MGLLLIGIICLILGFVFSIQLLWVIGVVLVIIGLVLLLFAELPGRPAGRRYRHWY